MGSPSALHIEALKDGEEPIAFGPNSLLVNYGDGWNLETVTDLDFSGNSFGIIFQFSIVRLFDFYLDSCFADDEFQVLNTLRIFIMIVLRQNEPHLWM